MTPRALPPALHAVNEASAFLLELVAFGALGWWGATQGSSLRVSIALGGAATVAAIVVWSLFAAPKARIRLPVAGVVVVKLVVFAAAAGALYVLRGAVVALVFAGLAVVNTALATLDREALFRAARK